MKIEINLPPFEHGSLFHPQTFPNETYPKNIAPFSMVQRPSLPEQKTCKIDVFWWEYAPTIDEAIKLATGPQRNRSSHQSPASWHMLPDREVMPGVGMKKAVADSVNSPNSLVLIEPCGSGYVFQVRNPQ